MSYYNQGPPQGPPHGHSPYPPQQGGYPPPPPQQPYGQQGYPQQPPPPMSYQQGGWGQPPPQQGYGPPPGGQYPPQGGQYPPQGGHYPPQGSPYPPQGGGYGAPPGPPPGQYGQGPPSGQYGPPPGQYGAPPPGPPPGQYGAPPLGPPPGQYGAPPPGPPGGYGAPPGGQYGGPPAQPSPGYMPGQQGPDMSQQADGLRSAMKGFGTDENALISILAPLDPIAAIGVKATFNGKHRRDLMKDIHGETSGYFREGLKAIVRGPLEQDCHTAHEALSGAGTDERALDEVLLGRSNADMNAIKQHYQHMYGKSLESDVKGDLSAKTQRLFEMVMAARRTEDSAGVNPQQVEQDVQELHRATEGQMGTDEISVCSIISSKSNPQLYAISEAYHRRFQRSLQETVHKEFSGHMEDALVYMLRRAENPARHDADLLEEAMAGMGTKDEALVRRVIMVHWDPRRLDACKAVYKQKYGKDLANRIKGETRGDYEKLLVACVRG